MVSPTDRPSASLGRLPVEIKRLILSELDDFDSLKSATLSGRALHSAFTSGIASQVLSNQIGVQVLPEAVASIEASRLPPKRTAQELSDFLEQHFHAREGKTVSLTVAQATSFAKLDDCVGKLAFMFAKECLARVPVPKPQNPAFDSLAAFSTLTPTATETARIRRALYRFEAFSKVFRKHRTFRIPDKCLDDFWRRFSNWENEQLACIQDFLYRLASPGKPAPLTPMCSPQN